MDRATGAIGILNIEIRFVLESAHWLMLAGGAGELVAPLRVSRWRWGVATRIASRRGITGNRGSC
jgi:hypothetical protein